jgi:group I intron endonuclease
METAGIYKITHKPTGMVYVGSSINLLKRKKHHFCALRAGRHHNDLLQAEWNKGQAEDFAFGVLCFCDPDPAVMLSHEQFYIDAYQACRGGKGFNLSRTAGTVTNMARAINAKRRKESGVAPKPKPAPASVDADAIARVLEYAKLPFFNRESAIPERQTA